VQKSGPPKTTFSESEKRVMIALLHVPGIGQRTLNRLLQYQKKTRRSICDLWVNFGHESLNDTILKKKIESIKKFKKEHKIYEIYERLKNQQIRVIFLGDLEYPTFLKEISDPPLALFVKGNVGAWSRPCIGVVGSRKMTPYGKMVARTLVRQLAGSELTIVSGCMVGVDATAHQAALAADGLTIGVLGFGFDYWYPRELEQLGEQIIAQGGALVSEYAPNTRPAKGHFVARNRIIAGLSAGLVVVEAAEHSGSHSTVRFAADEGRSVFAVPGPITSPFSEGTKSLLCQGAIPVSSAADIVGELSLSYPMALFTRSGSTALDGSLPIGSGSTSAVELATKSGSNSSSGVGLAGDPIAKALRSQPLSADALARELELPISTVSTQLSLMEVEGLVVSDGILWFWQSY
jgi:DNA processing protein